MLFKMNINLIPPAPHYIWTYSYNKATFEQMTGWTRWIKANPVLPFNNPPFGDEGDTNKKKKPLELELLQAP